MQKVNGWSQAGNTVVSTSGLPSSTVVQGSYPLSTVTVYDHGTVTPASIFSDNSGTPLGNPFTVSATGTFGFYAANGRYDLVFSGLGISAPFTISDILLEDTSSLFTDVTASPYNATGNGTTNDSTAIQAALNSGASVVIVPPGNYNIGTTTITIPSTCIQFLMLGTATLIYSGTGIALVCASRGASASIIDVSVTKTVANWDPMTGTGSDTTSMGFRLYDCAFTTVNLILIENFAIGCQLYSDGTNTVFNNIYISNILNNAIGIQTLAVGGGAATNQNQFYNGSINIDSSHTTQLAGTKYVDIENGNMNTFIGTNLENAQAQYSLYVNDSLNMFINLRYEGNQAGAVNFTSSANSNTIFGGYYSDGDFDVIADAGTANMYLTTFGLRMGTNTANANTLNLFNTVLNRLSLTFNWNGNILTVGNLTDGGTVNAEQLNAGTGITLTNGQFKQTFSSLVIDAVEQIDTRSGFTRTWVLGPNTGEGHSYGFHDSTGNMTVMALSDGANAVPYQIQATGTGGIGNKVVTFATLPASPAEGTAVWIHDSNTAVFNATITGGGGGNRVLACYDGTNWKVH